MFYGATGLTALNTTNWDTDPLPTSTFWNLNMTGTIYCNDPDSGGTGATGTGTVNGEACESIYTNTDSDNIADLMEVLLGLDPDLAQTDTDGDDLPDIVDNDINGPGIVDTDGDGLSDDLEDRVLNFAPNWIDDFDGDGIPDSSDPNDFGP